MKQMSGSKASVNPTEPRKAGLPPLRWRCLDPFNQPPFVAVVEIHEAAQCRAELATELQEQ